ncbi:unnamed protein product, partial [Pylaiella littoralis]
MVTPPPPRIRVRHGSGDGHHAVGVSTTPYTGLDVLFRTPKQQQDSPEQSSRRQHHHHLHHQPTLSPSRGHTRWADPFFTTTTTSNTNTNDGDRPRSPQRSRLTWCAGEGQGSIEARGGRAPPNSSGMEGPESPPLYSLGERAGKWALEAPAWPSDPRSDGRNFPRGGEGFDSRPRSATEGLAAG